MKKVNHPKEKALFFLGVLLYSFILKLINSTCLIRSIFHIHCPGCGMTRAILSAATLDFEKAAAYHPLWILCPLILLYFLYDGSLFGKRADRVLITVIVILFALVWTLRWMGVLTVL